MCLEKAVSLKLSVSLELLDHLLPNGVFNSHNPKGIRFTVKLPMGISNFRTTNAGIFFKIYYTKFVMAC